MRLALVQFNPVVGDVRTNARRAGEWIRRAAAERADLVVFPELALTGYPPRDLLFQDGFGQATRDAARALAAEVRGPTVMLGAPWRPAPGGPAADSWSDTARLTNSVLVMRAGRIAWRYDKRLLPTYDVFDEDRYFAPGESPLVIDVMGVRVGVSVCEDLWRGADAGIADRYAVRADPVADLVRAGATLIVNPSASPFVLGKGERQRRILTRHVAQSRVAVAAVNQVGGNDDLIFDGHAAVYAPSTSGPRLVAAGAGFEEGLVCIDVPAEVGAWQPRDVPDPLLTTPREELLWRALVLGVRDYCAKTGFTSCALGLSGGIDSALTACVAAAALGPANVTGVALPSRFSSQGSLDDAAELATRLGVRFTTVPIETMHAAAEQTLAPVWSTLGASAEPGVTEENVQSRVRGLLMMAVSNKTGAILLTTGNKSELAVGYCTLYGDMNGGLAVLSDVTKMDVYRLSRWINDNFASAGFASPPIPAASIDKPPSAELRPNQTDQDSLPPYDVLDQIIERYVERRQSAASIVRETAFDAALVSRITRLIDIAEYKRRQMPTGLKVTSNAFGPGRRWPIAQGYRE
jgi:NAD+ synthase (glutamine-hydrolysing)